MSDPKVSRADLICALQVMVGAWNAYTTKDALAEIGWGHFTSLPAMLAYGSIIDTETAKRVLQKALEETPLEPVRGTRPNRRAKKCAECGTHWADPPSTLCPGCEAYRDHTR